MNKSLLPTLLITALFSTSAFAEASDSFKKAEDAVKYRKAAFRLISHNFADMGAMMKGKKPFNANVFSARADNVAALSHLPLEGFIKNSNISDSKAKDDIWGNKADFETKMQKFQVDTANLARIAASGDQKAIKSAFGQTAKNCKSCHKNYKQD